ncbi:MAG: M1 family metallopeptidase [Vulcanimicrobiota bacterium]
MQRLALIFCLLFLVHPVNAEDIRLTDAVRPLRQSVFLEVDPKQDDYRGSTEIKLELKEEGREIILHALDIEILEAGLETGGKSLALTPSSLDHGKVKLSAGEALGLGPATLKVAFRAPFNRRSVGLYKYFDGDTPYLSTQFEMTDARRCFPCFDQPNFKIPYQLTVKAPQNTRVYSNATASKKTEQGDWTVHAFAETLPLPSYLVALAVGPYEETVVPKLSVPGRLVTTRGKLAQSRAAAVATPPILEALQDYFDIPYAYGKLDQIAVTEFAFGAMENAGMITYREDVLLINEATAQRRNRERMYAVVAHELAHQWFGNLVTMKWWDDLWLNEAFATWMANKVLIQLYPELERELLTYQNQAMGEDGKLTARPIRKPIRSDSDIIDGLGLNYTKGAAILTMVEQWIGADSFRQGIRNYMQAHKFGNAEATDLWSSLSEASEKDVSRVLSSYIEQAGYPIVELYPQGREMVVQQRRFAYSQTEPPKQTWTFPLGIRYGAGDRQASHHFLMEGAEATVEFEFQPEWIFPDAGGVGYYRWNLDRSDLDTLVFKFRDRLSTRERIALQANLSGLYDAGILSAGEYLAMTSVFLEDAHPAVVSPALQSLASLRDVMVDEANHPEWRAYLREITRPLRQRLGDSSRDGEPAKDSDLRLQLFRMLARDVDDPTLLERSRGQAESYLSGRGTVDQALIGAHLYMAAKHGDAALVERVIQALSEAQDPQRRTALLEMLGHFEEPEAHAAALDAMLTPLVTPSDLRTLLDLNGQDDRRRQRLQGWIEENYEALSHKIPSAFLAYIVSSQSGLKSLTELERVKAFYAAQSDPNGALKRELEKVTEAVRLRVAEKERGVSSFSRAIWLD